MPRKDETNCCCEKPEILQGKPEDCTPEQIRKCHGESDAHPCCDSHEQKK